MPKCGNGGPGYAIRLLYGLAARHPIPITDDRLSLYLGGTMTRKAKLFCEARKFIRFAIAVLTLVGMMAAAWVQLGGPVPATAEDVEKLSAGQARLGIKVQLTAEKALRKELSDAEFNLLVLQNQGKKDQTSMLLRQHLLNKIREIKAQQELERSQRQAYRDQLLSIQRK